MGNEYFAENQRSVRYIVANQARFAPSLRMLNHGLLFSPPAQSAPPDSGPGFCQ